MQIAILGRGNMGAPLATILRKSGHQVDSLGRSGDHLAALQRAELVILALKYEQAIALAAEPNLAESLAGKVVIDITNPLAPDFMSLTIGHETSGAEEIAQALPRAIIVKAFNTIFAPVLVDHAEGKTCRLPIFVSGDEDTAVETVVRLVNEMGLKATKAGPLSNARYLEPMTEMMIQFGYALGHGDRIGFALSAAS